MSEEKNIEESSCYKLQASSDKHMHLFKEIVPSQLTTTNHKRPTWKHMPTILTQTREKNGPIIFLNFSCCSLQCSAGFWLKISENTRWKTEGRINLSAL